MATDIPNAKVPIPNELMTVFYEIEKRLRELEDWRRDQERREYPNYDSDLAALDTRLDTLEAWKTDTVTPTLNSLASTYETQAHAASTYLTQANAASTYLTQLNAASTYETLSHAASTYLTISTAASTYLTTTDASTTYETQSHASSTYETQSHASSTYTPKSVYNSHAHTTTDRYTDPGWNTSDTVQSTGPSVTA